MPLYEGRGSAQVPQGRLKICRNAILDKLQPSLRDLGRTRDLRTETFSSACSTAIDRALKEAIAELAICIVLCHKPFIFSQFRIQRLDT
jgi:hypothetical protein